MPADHQGPEEMNNVPPDEPEHMHNTPDIPPDKTQPPSPDDAATQSVPSEELTEEPTLFSKQESTGEQSEELPEDASETSVAAEADEEIEHKPTQALSGEEVEESDEQEGDTAKRPAVVIPPSRPAGNKVVTPRQEKAMRYLERKRTRQERLSTPLPAVNANGDHANNRDVSVVADQKTVQIAATPRYVPVLSGPNQGVEYGQGVSAYQPSKSDVPLTAIELRKQRHKRILVRHISRKHMRQGRLTDQRSSSRFWSTIVSTLAIAVILFLTITGAGAYAAYRFYSDTQAQYSKRVVTLHDLLPKDNLKIYDSQGIPLYQNVSEGAHTSVSLNQIAPILVKGTIAVEDKTFLTNPGVDFPRLLQAAFDDFTHTGAVSGGSTITQQLVKNLVLGNQSQTTIRKLQEIVLTPSVNTTYSKSDIMQMYLNSIYYGNNSYGIDAAASTYFGYADQPGKSAASQLDLAQAAMLTGFPNSPTQYNPFKYPDAAMSRFKVVLELMLRNGVITQDDALAAEHEAAQPDFYKAPTTWGNRAPHFTNFVERQLEKQYHLTDKELARSDMSVYTTLDINLQDQIQKIAQKDIADLAGHNVHNAAEVLIDFHTGAIRSLLGSIDYNNTSIDGQFDVATQGYRQPGSSFKPYAYVTAFEQGASPGQAIDDNPINVPQQGGPSFHPSNDDNKTNGHMTLRCALQNSLNIPAVKVLQHVGIDATMKTAKDMGIQSYTGFPGLALVLGGLNVQLLDHTSAYGTFANGGVHVPYYAVDKIVYSTVNKTILHKQDPGTQVISPQMAYMMTNVLSDNPARYKEFFTCNLLQLYSNSQADCFAGNPGTIRPAAAKTGTTDNFKDNWTMGYTTDYVMGVWAGNDDNTPMQNIFGISGAAPIWHESMQLAEQNHPIKDFTNPGGLQTATVTYPDGVRSTDLYLPGKVPSFNVPAPVTSPGTTAFVSPNPGDPGKPKGTPTSSFCPTSYSFAFSPPADDYLNGSSPNPGWW